MFSVFPSSWTRPREITLEYLLLSMVIPYIFGQLLSKVITIKPFIQSIKEISETKRKNVREVYHFFHATFIKIYSHYLKPDWSPKQPRETQTQRRAGQL